VTVIVRLAPRQPGMAPADWSVDEVIPDGAGPNLSSGVAYAGLVTRAIAIVIDGLLIDVAALSVTGAVLLVESLFNVTNRNSALAGAVGVVLFFVWVVSYFAVFWTATGQTPGSRVMQIRVTRPDGTRVRPLRAFIRLVGMVVSLPLFWGYLPILWTRRRRSACDFMAGTVVTVVPSMPRTGRHGSAGPSHPHPSGIEPASTVP
jgi:uncharacterized RDD family membrane protein YckC